jgi:DNA (cytosine-5)-methyltransferase 1
MVIQFGDDCTGLSAPILALKKLGKKIKYVFMSEIDNDLREHIRIKHKPELVFDDITKRDHTKLPKIDLYVSGFPCQSFSTVGKNQGFKTNQGIIFFHCFRTIEETKPKYFILENVKGLLTHESGKTLQTIKKYLSKLKEYQIHYEIINSKYFVPQDRERIYIIGVRDLKKKYNFKTYPTQITHIKDIVDKKNKTVKHLIPTKKKLLNDVVIKKNINLNDWWVINLNTSGVSYATARKNLSPTILTSSQMYYITPLKRFLTINELLKLQGFNNYDLSFLTKTKQFRSVGNTMTIDVFVYIFTQLQL